MADIIEYGMVRINLRTSSDFTAMFGGFNPFVFGMEDSKYGLED